MYTALRGEIAEVDWASIVWTQFGIPRHNFLTWLFVLDRSPTKDRMRRWGLQVSQTCLLCNSGEETRNHLFMDCPFSYDLWSQIARRCDFLPLADWTATLDQMKSLPSQKPLKHQKILTLWAWQSTIYWMWNERNRRLHSNSFRSIDALFSLIDRQLRNKTQTLRHSHPTLASQALQLWIRHA